MSRLSRRRFVRDMSTGALIAGIGSSLVSDWGLPVSLADEPAHDLSFGNLEPLVDLMQDVPLDRFQADVVEKLRTGTSLGQIVAACALANARSLGGTDYVGYHSLMALAPAYSLASGDRSFADRALPVLKVLYRNARQIREAGDGEDSLHPVEPTESSRDAALRLRDLVRTARMDDSERYFAGMASHGSRDAFDGLQPMIQDDINVHRVVLVWRAWSLLPLTGEEHAHTMLRQSVRFCVDAEQDRLSRKTPEPAVRETLEKLVHEFDLLNRTPGKRQMDDSWVMQLAESIQRGTREASAEQVAAALADGISPTDVSEAISLAANRLVLCDPGRIERWASKEKPVGSVHGDSVGVHASDAANAWRNIAAISPAGTALTSLVVAAFHTGGQQRQPSDVCFTADDVHRVSASAPEELLSVLESSIRENDQTRASAIAQRWGDLGLPPKTMMELLRKYAISEDGALHAEKFYQTVSEEFLAIRPSLRWGQIVALARVTASEFGHPAPGLDEAQRLLNA